MHENQSQAHNGRQAPKPRGTANGNPGEVFTIDWFCEGQRSLAGRAQQSSEAAAAQSVTIDPAKPAAKTTRKPATKTAARKR